MTTTTKEPKKRTRVNLSVDTGPHALLKITAAAMGVSLDEAYSQAARLWNAAHVKRGQNGGATIPLSNDLATEAFRESEVKRYVGLAAEIQAEGKPKRS